MMTNYSREFELDAREIGQIDSRKFNYQVAGHANIQSLQFPVSLLPHYWKSRHISTKGNGHAELKEQYVDVAVKPTTWKEARFYMDLLLTNEASAFSKWIPRFYGYSTLDNTSHSPTSPINSHNNNSNNNGNNGGSGGSSDSLEGDRKVLIYLQNVTPTTSPPNSLSIIDIKLGWRHYDDEAAPTKRTKMIQLVQETSSRTLGIRITGSLVLATGEKRDKLYFKPILEYEDIKGLLVEDVLRGLLTAGDRRYICSQLAEMKRSVGGVSLYSTSMLFIFNESVPSLDSPLGDSDGHASSTPPGTSNPVLGGGVEERIKLFWVDFAHSYAYKPMSEWELEGVTTGLTSLMRIFAP